MPEDVLVVDDEPLLRELLVAQVGALGHRARAVASGREALAAAVAEPPPTVIVTDVRMPGLAGPELVRALAEAAPGLPVVVISGVAKPATIEACRAAGAVDYLVKPFDLDRLARALDSATAHRTALAGGGTGEAE